MAINGVEVWGYCDANCRHRVLTVDQVVELIQEMAANGFQVPEDYLPKTAVNSIIEQNTGSELKIWLGTQAQWDAWTDDKTNVFAIISDDQTLNSIKETLSATKNSLNKIIDGSIVVPSATNATNAILKSNGTYTGFTLEENGVLKVGDIIVPQKKLLFYDANGDVFIGTKTIYTDTKSLHGRVFEVAFSQHPSNETTTNYAKFRVNTTRGTTIWQDFSFAHGDGSVAIPNVYTLTVNYNSAFELQLSFARSNDADGVLYNDCSGCVYALYEIIE